jgi:serine protease Do
VGDKIEVKALRDGQEISYQIVVTERKEQPEVASAGEMKENFGITVQDITPDIARYLGIASRVGVIVVDVKDGSPADEKGIQPQDIILEVNKVKISSLKDYQREISKKSAKNSVLLLIKRGKAKYFVSLRK